MTRASALRPAAVAYPRVSLYALLLAAAGVPLYIHLPQFATVELGIGLGSLGAVLLAIRLFDLVQDPLIGWGVDRFPQMVPLFALLAAAGLALGFPLLFTLQPGPWVLAQLVAVLLLMFSAYSLGMILLYGQSASLALRATPGELMRLAAYREAGMLGGVVLAAVAPTILVLAGAGAGGYPAFGLLLGGVAVLVALITRPIWRRPVVPGQALSLQRLIAAGGLRLLLLALLNSLPVALTSTLFLFFVQDRLQLPDLAGPLLLLFFLSAGVSVPLWSRLSQSIGPKRVLLIAMPLAILGFVGAAALAPGNLAGFALICVASGAALGADMVLLPAMFSIALTRAGLSAATAFGIWSFAGKLALALAAALALPLLDLRGYVPGQPNPPEALAALTLGYAVLPCVLKSLAFAFVLTLPSERGLS